MIANQFACEADLRAEQRASGAEMALADLRLHGGVERSDKDRQSIRLRGRLARRVACIRRRNDLATSRLRSGVERSDKIKDPVVGSTGSFGISSESWTIDQAVCAVVCLVTLSA